jgi:hypothetical protein
MRYFVFLTTIAASLATLPLAAQPVHEWNGLLLDSVRAMRTNPPMASRQMAILNVSIFDAVNGLDEGFKLYHVAGPGPAGASPEAAAIAAGHRVLSALYPARQAIFDQARGEQLAAIPDGSAKQQGVDWGTAVADQILTLRQDDGSSVAVGYEEAPGAGWWIPTPPAFAAPLLPGWGQVRPWTMTHGAQFRVSAPPPVTSPQYFAAFEEVRLLGDSDSPLRTADQTEIARFWDDGAGTQTPPGHWIDIARLVSAQQGLDLLDTARLFALLGMTVADAAIVAWDNKFHYNHWRPYTGVLEADDDGNPATTFEADWNSLIATPPFPAYTSGHSTFSGGSGRLLGLFFGRDDVGFTIGSDGLPGEQRSFASFSQASEEAGQSRIYGGIHWQYDNQQGLSSGRALAEHVFFNFLRPVNGPSSCVAGPTTLCLAAGRFRVETRWRTAFSTSGPGQAIADSADAGRFWFFDQDNTEVVVKVLDACAGNDRFWVFSSGLTNVEVTLTVTDTRTGDQRVYFNPLDRSYEAVLDASAFATCP